MSDHPITIIRKPTAETLENLELKVVNSISFKNYVGREEIMRDEAVVIAKDFGFDAIYITSTQVAGSPVMTQTSNFYNVKK